MHSVLLLSGLAATCLGAALPPRRETIYPSGVSTVFVTVTVPAVPARETIYRPRNAAPEPNPQVLGSPTRTVLESPTPPRWWWWPTPTPAGSTLSSELPRTTSYYPRNAAPEPQALGSPSRTLQVSPTPPWWWGQWPTATPVVEKKEKREPQALGSVSRTVQVSPTPPWWWGWPAATPVAEREVDEKREPQTLVWGDGGSRSSNPTTLVTLPIVTLDKRNPQSLVPPISRTNQVTPTGPSTEPPHHHHTSSISIVTVTVTVTLTDDPWSFQTTIAVPPLPTLTLYKKNPQSLVPPISRTDQITPTGPSPIYSTRPYNSTGVVHHHSSSPTRITTTESPSSTRYPSWTYPTGTEIDTTLTVPFPTLVAQRAEGTSVPKEDPCNNPFEPPIEPFCSTRSASIVVTTFTNTNIGQTVTLPPVVVGTPPPTWGI